MKGVIVCDLADPDEAKDYQLMLKAVALRCILWDLQEDIHRTITIGDLSAETEKYLEEIREKIISECRFHEINLFS